MKQKVLAFILRTKPTGPRQILLHSFITAPQFPLRLPGGGIDPGETPEQALRRELREETSLTDLRLARKLGVQSYFKSHIQAQVERHDFLLWANEATPDSWEVQVKGKGDDAGDLFGLQWLDVDSLSGIDEEHRPFLNPNYIPELFQQSHTLVHYQNKPPTLEKSMKYNTSWINYKNTHSHSPP